MIGIGLAIALGTIGLAVAMSVVLGLRDAWVIAYFGVIVGTGFAAVGLIAAGVRLGMRGALRD